MREIFVVDSFHYKGANRSPLIIRMPHARLSQPGCNMFEMCFQTIVSLLAGSKEPDLINELLPMTASLIDKYIERDQSLKFVMKP